MERTINCDGYTLKVDGKKLVKVEAQPSITDVVIPEGITSIESEAFLCLKIKTVCLPQSLISISVDAFLGCHCLTSVTIPNAKVIEYMAFDDCENLKEVFIGAGVSEIKPVPIGDRDDAMNVRFTVDEANKHYTAVDGILFSKDMKKLISFPMETKGDFLVPESVEELGEYAFCNSQLSSILLPAGITVIEKECFYFARWLKKVDIYYPNQDYTPSSASVCLPPNLKIIPPDCFANCDSISDVVIPEKTEIIENMAFCASSVTNVQLPYSLKEIGYSAFGDCSIKELTLPPNLRTIRNEAFAGNPIRKIELPSRLTHFAGDVFAKCTKLENLTVDSNNPNFISINNVVFSKDLSTLVYFSPSQKGHYTIPSTVHKIGDFAFYNAFISSITIPGNVTEIGSHAFCYCQNLTSIKLSKGLKSISGSAFYCSGLNEITLPESIEYLSDDGVFNDACHVSGPQTTTKTSVLRALDGYSRDGISVTSSVLSKWQKLRKLNTIVVRSKIETALTERGFKYLIITERKWKQGTIPRHRNIAFFRIKLYKDDKKFEAQIDHWCRKGKRYLVLIMSENELWSRV